MAIYISDSGSQLNFITKKFCNKLKIEKHQTSVTIKGISGNNTHTAYNINTTIHLLNSNFKAALDFYILSNITNLVPFENTQFNKLDQLENIQNHLADRKFNESAPIHVLLGAEIFYKLLKHNK